MLNRHALALAAALLCASAAPVFASIEPVLVADPSQLSGVRPSPAQEHISRGWDALQREDYAAAETAFRKAMSVDPKSPVAFIGMAEMAGRKGQPGEVDNWLQKAVAADPTSTLAQRTWAKRLVQKGKFSDAEQALRKALAAEGSNADAQLELGGLYLGGLKNPKAAEEAFRAAAAQSPTDARALVGLARALVAQGKNDAALAAFDAAAKLNPADPQPWLFRSRFLASQLKFADAQASLVKALAAAPDYLPAYIDQGDLYLATNENDKAIAAYQAGAKATKQPALAYFRLALVLEAKEQWREAEQAYLDAVGADPTMFGAYNNLAFMAASRKVDPDKALAWAKKAIELSPKTMTLYDTLGWVHRARGEFAPAVTAINKAITANPKQASFRYHLGLVYVDMGKKPEAVAALKKALELDPNFRQAADAKSRLQQLGAK
jgi:tetratricopeptide (TPR) repeat protein